jgi:hypothetical protein
LNPESCSRAAAVPPPAEWQPDLRYVEGDDVVADVHAGHSLAHALDHAAALVAEDRGEDALGIGARKSVG